VAEGKRLLTGLNPHCRVRGDHLAIEWGGGDDDFSSGNRDWVLTRVGDHRNGPIRKRDNVTTKSVKPHQRALAETLLASEP